MIALDSEALEEGDEEIAERHIETIVSAGVDVAQVLKASAGNEDREIEVRVGAAVTHSRTEKDDGVIEHGAIGIWLGNGIEPLQAAGELSDLKRLDGEELGGDVCYFSVVSAAVVAAGDATDVGVV